MQQRQGRVRACRGTGASAMATSKRYSGGRQGTAGTAGEASWVQRDCRFVRRCARDEVFTHAASSWRRRVSVVWLYDMQQGDEAPNQSRHGTVEPRKMDAALPCDPVETVDGTRGVRAGPPAFRPFVLRYRSTRRQRAHRLRTVHPPVQGRMRSRRIESFPPPPFVLRYRSMRRQRAHRLRTVHLTVQEGMQRSARRQPPGSPPTSHRSC